jgi:MYXO-CTERM domain-containing protein
MYGMRGLCLGVGIVGYLLLSATAAQADEPLRLERCGLEPITPLLEAPIPPKANEVPNLGASGLPIVRRALEDNTITSTSTGALSGKTVYVSPGHGWLWKNPGWRLQRGNTHDVVEDLISTEVATQYLVNYLRNMGAYVVTLRENDMNPNRAYGDDEEDNFTAHNLELEVNNRGFGVAEYYNTGTNPFRAGESKVFDASAESTGHVQWTFDVPEAGEYNVYVGYVQAADRASDAHYTIRHAGGETSFYVDQRRHGSTWVYLGRFYFEAGVSEERGAVLLDNRSADENATLSADVVRIGGGLSAIKSGGESTGRPAYEDSAKLYTQYAGAPSSVYSSDVSARSKFAAWDHEAGEDAVYIAWHTNAATGNARGTSSFAYGPTSFGPISGFSGVPGSVELLSAVHNELVDDLQAGWDSDWPEFGQGLYAAYFGEVSPNHNPEMPAGLFEVGFHDNAEDAEALSDPGFRRVAGRAMAQGVARYFAERDGLPLVLAPDEPRALAADQEGSRIRFHWQAPALESGGGDEATGYRIYLSKDGLAFDAGRDVDGLSFEVSSDSARFARVTAINSGGESFPSPIVGARASSLGRPQVLIVNDFDRLDRGQLLAEDLSDYYLGTVKRMNVARMNDHSYIGRYGRAIDASGVSFASATSAALSEGLVRVDDYAMVVWFTGESAPAISDEEATALTNYIGAGGKLVLSGTSIAAGLADEGAARGALLEALQASFLDDDAGDYSLTGLSDFSEAGTLRFDDFGVHSYRAQSPDLIDALGSAQVALRYGDAEGDGDEDAIGGAAVLADQSLLLAFPFETLATGESREVLMAQILLNFDLQPDEAPDGSDPDDPDADPNTDDLGTGDLIGGCGCRSTNSSHGGWTGLLLLVGLAWLRRTRL